MALEYQKCVIPFHQLVLSYNPKIGAPFTVAASDLAMSIESGLYDKPVAAPVYFMPVNILLPGIISFPKRPLISLKPASS